MIKDCDQLSLNLCQGHPLYDKIVSKTQPLRLINEQISFVNPLLGPVYSHEVMFRILF